MKNKRIITVLICLTVIFTILGGSLAAFRWRTSEDQKTNVVFTINSQFSCAADGGGDIKGANLVPASCTNSKYAIQRKVTVTPSISGDISIGMNLWLDINELGSGLSQTKNFRYALTTVENDCTSGIVSHGNFYGLSGGHDDKVILLDEERYNSSQAQTYYLYIWIDPREEDNIVVDQKFDFSLGGSCSEVVKGEPFYAVYSENESSLRFYKEEPGVIIEGEEYDGRIASKVYTAYENDIYTYDSSTTKTTSPWDGIRDNVTSVVIEDEISPVSTANWFTRFVNTSSVDVTKLNTSNVKSMYRMFDLTGYNVTTSFTITGLDNWNTSKVINMERTFQGTGAAATTWSIGDLTNWDVSNVITMENMFLRMAYKTKTVDIGDISNWDTSKVTNMIALFGEFGYSAEIFDAIDLTNWDVSNVTNMSHMFNRTGYGSTTWSIGDLSKWDTSNVKDINLMFNKAGSGSTTWSIGDLSTKTVTRADGTKYTAWDVSNVTNMYSIFGDAASNAEQFNLGNLSNWDVSNVTDMSYMFVGAGKTATDWNIGDLSNWDTSSATNMSHMFQTAGNSATTFNLGNLNNWNVSKVTDFMSMFYDAGYNATECNIGDLSKWDTSSAMNMSHMFQNICFNDKSVSIGDLSTKTVTRTDGTQYTAWNVSNVTNIRQMFAYTGFNSETFSLGNISNWNTSNVTNMYQTFLGTGSHSSDFSLNLSGWDVPKVIYYDGFNTNGRVTPPTWVNADQGIPSE